MDIVTLGMARADARKQVAQNTAFKPSDLLRRMVGAAVMATPPTITIGTGTTSLTGAVWVKPQSTQPTSPLVPYNSPTYNQGGARPVDEVVARQQYQYSGLAYPQPGAQPVMWPFDFFGTKFELYVANNAAKYRVWVDEQPHAAQPITASDGSPDSTPQHRLIDFGGTPRWRRIMIEGESTFRFLGLKIEPTATVRQSSYRSRGRLMVLGDSITEGNHAELGESAGLSTNYYQMGSWALSLGRRLGILDTWQGLSIGGTGIYRAHAGGSPNFLTRMTTDVSPYDPDCLLVTASPNDLTPVDYTNDSPGLVTTNVQAIIAAAKAARPTCTVIFTGMIGSNMFSPGVIAEARGNAYEAEVKAALGTALADQPVNGAVAFPNDVWWIPTRNPDGTPWISGDGNVVAPDGLGTADYFAPQQNGTTILYLHPNQAGHDATAQTMAPIVAAILRIPTGPSVVPDAALALPVTVQSGRIVVGANAVATTFGISEAGGGSVAGSLGAYGAVYLDPALFPSLFGLTCKLRVSGRVITNSVAPACDFTFRLRPILTWASGANPAPATFGAALGAVTITAPTAGGPHVATGVPFAFPAAGWYNLELVTSATSAASSSTHTNTRLERIYS